MRDKELIPTLTHATERDVDLLLVEELIASEEFLTWIAAKAGLQGRASAWRVLHSKRRIRNRREIDIFVEIETDGGRRPSVLLIENKLSEDEQPDQAESYREELARISDDCAFAAMLLVCPGSYAQVHPVFAAKFDSVISYESIVEFLRSRSKVCTGEASRRLAFRADLLDQAIHKFRRGYTPVPNEVIGSFNQRYVALLKEIAPEIEPGKTMLRDAPPDESVSMIFDHEASLGFLEQSIRPRRFAHELGRNQEHRANYVAVTFGGWGRAWPQIEQRLLADTHGTGFVFSAKAPNPKRPNPGLVMSLATRPVDNQGDFEVQQPFLEEGIRTARRLQEWLRDNQPMLREWRDAVAAALTREDSEVQ